MSNTAKAYIGTTRFIENESELMVPKFGFNGDTAYLVNSANDEVIAEYTKKNGKWIKVNTGGKSSDSNIDINPDSDFADVIEQVITNTSEISKLKSEIPDVSNFVSKDELPNMSNFITVDSEYFINLLQKVSDLESEIEDIKSTLSTKPGLKTEGQEFNV